jgi:hypothetical protein
VPKASSTDGPQLDTDLGIRLRLDGFARETLEQESTRLGVSAEEVATFAVLYYLADLDSGRISRELPRSPFGHDDQGLGRGPLGTPFPRT